MYPVLKGSVIVKVTLKHKKAELTQESTWKGCHTAQCLCDRLYNITFHYQFLRISAKTFLIENHSFNPSLLGTFFPTTDASISVWPTCNCRRRSTRLFFYRSSNILYLLIHTVLGVKWIYIFAFITKKVSWDSVVGIETGYGMDDRGVGVRVPVGSRIFASRPRPDRLWGLPNLLTNGYRGLFLRG
jgi:hypothetical protein